MKREKKIYQKARDKKKKKWNRVLPYAEYLVDRWEKAKYLGFKEGTGIYDSSFVLGNVKVGKNVWIGPYTMLDGSGAELRIGNHCSISTGVQIYTHDTVLNCVSGGINPKTYGAVSIGDNSYIAPGVIVGKGVSIGKSCVICAKSFVNKSFDDYSIIGGIPAKKIGNVRIHKDGIAELEYFSHKRELSIMYGGGEKPGLRRNEVAA